MSWRRKIGQTDYPERERGGAVVLASTIARVFLEVEHVIYLAAAALMACAAALALVSAGLVLAGAIATWGAPEDIVATIDRLLFVLMLLEILHTVRVSIRDGALVPEPFLIVGLIASIRRVLVITLRYSEATNPGNWTEQSRQFFNASMFELGVLGVLILVMVIAIVLLRRRYHLAEEHGH